MTSKNQAGIKLSSLIIFLRPPRFGKVKTRLGAQVTKEFALSFYSKCIDILINEVRNSVEIEKFLFWADNIMKQDEDIYPEFHSCIQEGSDLGLRMRNAFNQVLERGESKVILIGTDIPDLDIELINKAFSNLEKNDVVLGPSTDGGYYLIGMKKMHGFLFEDVEYSVPLVLGTTISKIEKAGLSYSLLEELTDIDTEQDLLNWLSNRTFSKIKENLHISYLHDKIKLRQKL